MIDDTILLKRFAEQGAEDAFAEVVRRHLDLVYSAALRQVNGDAHLAQEVVQAVFTDLAGKAASVSRHRVPTAWLLVSTRFAAAKRVRAEQRRRAREREAQRMELNRDEHSPAGDWEQVRPVLDAALADLSEIDRAAISLRFFEGRGFAEVGERLRLTENSARMRVERALDKLHGLLLRRGVTSTTGALALALGNQAVIAAPAGLAASVTGAVLAGGAVCTSGGALATFMGLTKLQLGLVSAIVTTGGTIFISQQHAANRLRAQIAALQTDEGRAAALRSEHRQLVKTAAELERGREAGNELEGLRDKLASLSRQVAVRNEIAAAGEARAARKRLAAARVSAALERAQKQGMPDLTPKLLVATPPTYPPEMQAGGIPGKVVVSLVVGADGEVHDARAVKSTRPEFEAAAEEAVLRWTFEPGVKGLRAVNTRLEQPIVFALSGATVPPEELKPVDNSGGAWLQ
jgi:RNA polymerase sigma factor (sigma-70 family)